MSQTASPREEEREYIAHVTIAPNDGGERFTVETQFKAMSWVKAYEHIQQMSQTFAGTIQSHRIVFKDRPSEPVPSLPGNVGPVIDQSRLPVPVLAAPGYTPPPTPPSPLAGLIPVSKPTFKVRELTASMGSAWL